MVKKLILLGFGLVLLIGLPLVLFILQQQTQPVTKAAAVTKFSFDGVTQVTNGQAFSENLMVDPGGQNQVSFVKFTFTYDQSKLGPGSSFVAVDTTKYTILAAPNPTCTDTLCTVTRTISVGTNQAAIIKSKTALVQINFIAKANTDVGSPTVLNFVSGQNQALSVGSADQPAENVFQSGAPFSITVGNQGGTGTPIDTTTPTGTTIDSGSSGGASGSGNGSAGGVGGSGTLSVTCTSFTAQPSSGNPPINVTFTTVGSSSNDSITQIAINYGDGNSDTIASGSGIGTGNVNNQITHTYSSNGIFTAIATITTAGGATNNSSTCKATITIGTAVAQITANGSKLPPTGPGQTILLIGVAGAVLSAIGGFVLLGL